MPRSQSAVRSALLLTTITASAETPNATMTDIGPVASAKISLVAAVGIAEKRKEGSFGRNAKSGRTEVGSTM